MGKIDEAALRLMSAQDRHRIWQRARVLDTPDAKQMVDWIEKLGLPYSDDKALSQTDPIFIKMTEVIFSGKGREAAVNATKSGLPAMAGIDPLLVESLGIDYGPHNQGTMNAGYIVADMMRTQGYRTTGRKGKLPATCVAKTAEIFEPNS